jgi:hypothetical protein
MEEVRNKIIELFESKGENFKKSMTREFKKPVQSVVTPEMNKFKDILVYDIFKGLIDSNLFEEIENPFDVIETTLFNHINSK